MLLDSGHAVFLLSDGMGTGGRAAIDAAMTCGLLWQLMRAGFDADGAMGMVNGALMLRTEDETLSTVDCLCVDLFDGRAVLYKAGAASSFLRRYGEVTELRLDSLPLGIMERVDSASLELRLNAGDILLFVSDGVIGEGSVGWIERILGDHDPERDDLRSLAGRIVCSAPGTGSDDVTALAIRLELRHPETEDDPDRAQ